MAVAELGVVDYDDALAMQTAMLATRLDERIGDTLLMMEHPHVFTLGRGADERFIASNLAGVPIRRVSRGGQVTYHGPGQLVVYPLIDMRRAGLGVRDLVTALDHFMQLLEHNPNYAAAYFHGGQTLEKLGRIDEAKGLYRRGIEVTGAMGDDHTRSELQGALSMLG